MFGLGLTEILIVALVAFLVFGPEQFPSLARSFLKLLNELKAGFSDVQSEFDNLEDEVQKEFHNIKAEAEKELNLLGKKTPENKDETKQKKDIESEKSSLEKKTKKDG